MLHKLLIDLIILRNKDFGVIFSIDQRYIFIGRISLYRHFNLFFDFNILFDHNGFFLLLVFVYGDGYLDHLLFLRLWDNYRFNFYANRLNLRLFDMNVLSSRLCLWNRHRLRLNTWLFGRNILSRRFYYWRYRFRLDI